MKYICKDVWEIYFINIYSRNFTHNIFWNKFTIYFKTNKLNFTVKYLCKDIQNINFTVKYLCKDIYWNIQAEYFKWNLNFIILKYISKNIVCEISQKIFFEYIFKTSSQIYFTVKFIFWISLQRYFRVKFMFWISLQTNWKIFLQWNLCFEYLCKHLCKDIFQWNLSFHFILNIFAKIL